MTKSKKPLWKKVISYTTNALLLFVILVLIIPSWRVNFQGWYQGIFLSSAEFTEVSKTLIPEGERNWELVSMNDELLNFAEFKGKPVVLTFWATWCGACRAELPSLNDLRDHWDDEIVFAAVSTESTETIKESGLHEDYNFLYATQNYPRIFDVEVYPTLVIVDPEMNIVYRSEGAADLDNDKNIAFLNGLLKN